MDALTSRLYEPKLDRLRTESDCFADGLVSGCDVSRENFFSEVRRIAGDPHLDAFQAFIRATSDRDRDELQDLIDAGLVRHAQQFFATFGLQIATALLSASLVEAYAAGRGAQVLYLTGELVSDPARRVTETAQMLMTVMTPDPGLPRHEHGSITTLHPGRRGAVMARSVRLFHAMARRLVLESDTDRWEARQERFAANGPALGEPVNQEDLAGTLLTFTVTVFESLDLLGVPYTERDVEAWFHVWDVVGRHLGVGVESAFPAVDGSCGASHVAIARDFLLWDRLEMETGHEVMDLIRRRHRVATEEGKVLTNALLRELEAPLPSLLKPFPAALSRYLCGDEVGDLLGIREGGWSQYWLGKLRSSRRVHASLDHGLARRPARFVGGEIAATTTRGVLQMFLDDGRVDGSPRGAVARPRSFEVHGPLCRSWGLRATTDRRPMTLPIGW